MTNKSTTKGTMINTTKQSKTTSGIRKIFSSGTYRVEKQINGVRYSANFKKRRDAIKYLSLLNNEASKLKASN